MKKVLFILGMLLSLGMFCACSSDDDTPVVSEELNRTDGVGNENAEGEDSEAADDSDADSLSNGEVKGWTPPVDWTSVGRISDLTGYITYHKDLQAWLFISYWPMAMEDAFHCYYPIELGDEFKVEGLVITISGNIYLDEGSSRFYIELTQIEKSDSTKDILDRVDSIPMYIDDCYSGYVTDAEEDDIMIKTLLKDEDLIKVVVTETPPQDCLFKDDYLDNKKIVYFSRSDFQGLDIQVGDIVDFRIDCYKPLEIIHLYDNIYCHKYFCSVKPC